MRFLLAAALVIAPVALGAQLPFRMPQFPLQAEVHSVDPTKSVVMKVEMRGALWGSLGPIGGPDAPPMGAANIGSTGGTVTSPARLGLQPTGAGVISFESPADGPLIQLTLPGTGTAVGRVVRVVRDSTGQLSVEARPRAEK